MSGVADAPCIVAEPAPAAADDHRLVAAVRRGDDRAFEALYGRYHRRISAYVLGMVKDHGRAEDVTQEVFVAALRRMRQTERPIAFKPWIYEIAKNACIDQFRRSRRAEEVSIDAGDGLAASDYGRLAGSGPTPDAAVAVKQELDHLRGAFDEVSDQHHQILVLRELEGLSYREIGDRMGMSRPAVESTLFRARRRLTEEYDELVTGARCQRVQGLVETAVATRLGTRESNRLSRHLSHCQPCRRQAMVAGLDPAFLAYVPARRRVAAKLAGLLPLPGFARFGRGRGPDGDAGASVASGGGGGGPGWMAHIPMLSDHAAAPLAKLAAVAVVLVAGAGATGIGTHQPEDRAGAGGGDPAVAQPRPDAADAAGEADNAGAPGLARLQDRAPASERVARRREASGRDGADRRRERGAAGSNPGTSERPAPAGAEPLPTDGPSTQLPADDTPRDRVSDAGGGGSNQAPKSPAVELPSTGDVAEPIVDGGRGDTTPGGGGGGLQTVTEPVAETVKPVTEPVAEVVKPVAEAVKPVTEPITDAVKPVTRILEPVTDGVKPLTDGLGLGGLLP